MENRKIDGGMDGYEGGALPTKPGDGTVFKTQPQPLSHFIGQ